MDHEDEAEEEFDDERPRPAKRPDATPKTFSGADFPATEPTFVHCERCSKLAMRSPCYECGEGASKAAAAAEARDDGIGIPARYRWARPGAAELEARVHVEPLPPTDRHPNGRPRSAESAISVVAKFGGQAVVFHGPSGAGKSSLAVACLRAVTGSMFYVHALDLERIHIQTKAGTGRHPTVERALSVKTLLIDDVGQDRKGEHNAVEYLIHKRHEAHAPERGRIFRTWITTGLTLEQIDERFNTGTVRRILGDEIALHIPLVKKVG